MKKLTIISTLFFASQISFAQTTQESACPPPKYSAGQTSAQVNADTRRYVDCVKQYRERENARRAEEGRANREEKANRERIQREERERLQAERARNRERQRAERERVQQERREVERDKSRKAH